MTSPINRTDEVARQIVDKHLARPNWFDIGDKCCFVCGTPVEKQEYLKRSQAIVDDIASAIKSAVEAERERCAKVAESEYDEWHSACPAPEAIAKAIRQTPTQEWV